MADSEYTVVLPNPSIIQKIYQSVEDTEDLRKWVGNRLVYERARRWSRIIRFYLVSLDFLPRNEVLVTLSPPALIMPYQEDRNASGNTWPLDISTNF
jgi:hypothetical protein